jgi:hypothetical protein
MKDNELQRQADEIASRSERAPTATSTATTSTVAPETPDVPAISAPPDHDPSGTLDPENNVESVRLCRGRLATLALAPAPRATGGEARA